MMLHIIIGCLVAGLPLITIEVFSRLLKLNGELTRKATHVLSSLAVIALTVFCTLNEIAIIALIFFVLMISVRHKKLWNSLYHVKRQTWGEVLFPVGVIAASLLAKNVHDFVTTMLLLGLSDTVASILGQKFGKQKLPVVRHKSYIGSFACFICSFLILMTRHGSAGLLSLAIVALIVTIAEAVASKGLDNVLIPIAALGALAVINL